MVFEQAQSLHGGPSWMLMMLLAIAAILVLSGVVALVTMFIVGIAKNRPWMSVMAVGLGLFGLLGIGLFVALAVPAYQAAHSRIHGPHAEVYFEMPDAHLDWQTGHVEWHESTPLHNSLSRSVHWRIRFVPLLLVLVAALAILFSIVRRCKSGSSCGGRFPTWPQMAVISIAVLGMLMFIGFRSVGRVSQSSAQVAQLHADELTRATQHQASEASRQAEAMRKVVEQQVEEINNAHVSIEKLEDKFTGPRIPLPPALPEQPQPIDEAAASAQENDVDSESSTAAKAQASNEAIGTPAPEEKRDADESSTADETSESAEEQPQAEEPPAADEESNDTESDAEPDPVSKQPQDAAADEAEIDEAPVARIESDGAVMAADQQPATITPTSATAEASSAVKEMAASMTSFAKAINRAVDQYARAAAKVAEPDEPEAAAPSDAASASTDIDQAEGKTFVAAATATSDVQTANSWRVEASNPDEPRPSWVDDLQKRVGDTWQQVIVTDEYATIEECNRAADILLLLATYEHLMPLVGITDAAYPARPTLEFHNNTVKADGQSILAENGYAQDYRLQRLASMGIGINYIRHEVADGEYLETVQRSFGPMKKLYTRVKWDSTVDDHLRRRWNDSRRHERFAVVGVGAMSILGLLGTVWGMLKVDTMTKGYYTKRLFLGVPLGILGLFGLIALAIEAL